MARSREAPMLFMVAGYLKPDSEVQLITFRNEFNEHLSQPFRTLSAAGVLRDGAGRRCGYMLSLEARDIAEAESFLHESPFYQEGLYEHVDVFQYDVQVGQLG
jgi:uncharacterized protein YciI